jgi:uncharacterized protein YjbI with pentapeptide repeats
MSGSTSCKEDGCGGVLLEADGGCLAHTSPQLRQARLKQLRDQGELDARGVPIVSSLLAEILDAVPRDDHGHSCLPQVNFSKAIFRDPADFADTQFGDKASFEGAQFSDGANFEGAHFRDQTTFGRAQFSGLTTFDAVQFSGPTSFDDAQFSGPTSFDVAQFNDSASFQDTKFGGLALFGGTKFSSRADFFNAQFEGRTIFSGAQFSGDADFENAQFGAQASFGPLIVRGELILDRAMFGKSSDIAVGAQRVLCRRLELPDGVRNFRVRWQRSTSVTPTSRSPPSFPHCPGLPGPQRQLSFLSRPRQRISTLVRELSPCAGPTWPGLCSQMWTWRPVTLLAPITWASCA